MVAKIRRVIMYGFTDDKSKQESEVFTTAEKEKLQNFNANVIAGFMDKLTYIDHSQTVSTPAGGVAEVMVEWPAFPVSDYYPLCFRQVNATGQWTSDNEYYPLSMINIVPQNSGNIKAIVRAINTANVTKNIKISFELVVLRLT